ncbi:MAG TPA: deoxynucleoside kinase [Candidatus Marinimicrobia bacterium]|nr:deoxynucleoside kinase [Candidatus Neomarinimicrobiota bacterium]HRS52297.1 deoxynucleoside kinase [Candidatus Neomarinimicrobiota bacterium]HRU92035.1 deoxynucleoside kinase [Candidatus Neomarinimicrobiota bacterium]
MKNLYFLAIEGVIGAGKTSLAHLMAEKLNARLVLEKFEENPFLEDFYRDPERYAFQTQLFFLLSRYRQQVDLKQIDLFANLLISDYTFAKDKLFAILNLDEKELSLYNLVAQHLEKDLPKPDLVVYLQASTDRLMANIKKRGRSYEKSINRDYIDSLNQIYNEFFFRYKDSPLIIVNTNEIDFVNNENDLNELIREIKQPISGTVYYNPVKKI